MPQIDPEPVETRARAARAEFVFVAAGESVEVVFRHEVEPMGGLTGRIGLGAGPEVAVGQFVWP